MLSLTIDAQAIVNLDSSTGPVFIYIKNAFNDSGAFVDPLHSSHKLFIGVTGQCALAIGVPFSGSLVAPSSQLLLGSAFGPVSFTGEFFAQDITLLPNTTVSGQSFACP
jgi:hypothetical protein